MANFTRLFDSEQIAVFKFQPQMSDGTPRPARYRVETHAGPTQWLSLEEITEVIEDILEVLKNE